MRMPTVSLAPHAQPLDWRGFIILSESHFLRAKVLFCFVF